MHKIFRQPFTFVTIIISNFQNVLFYALSDDIKTAREKLLLTENMRFDIVFPGNGDVSSPGKLLAYIYTRESVLGKTLKNIKKPLYYL